MTPFSSLYKIFLPVNSVASLRFVHVLTSFSSEEESIIEISISMINNKPPSKKKTNKKQKIEKSKMKSVSYFSMGGYICKIIFYKDR